MAYNIVTLDSEAAVVDLFSRSKRFEVGFVSVEVENDDNPYKKTLETVIVAICLDDRIAADILDNCRDARVGVRRFGYPSLIFCTSLKDAQRQVADL